MLNRGNRLDVNSLKAYLVSIIKEFVEKPDKVVVTTDESHAGVIYNVSVDIDDLQAMVNVKFSYRALNHIMRKVTHANLGKAGTVNNEFGVTP